MISKRSMSISALSHASVALLVAIMFARCGGCGGNQDQSQYQDSGASSNHNPSLPSSQNGYNDAGFSGIAFPGWDLLKNSFPVAGLGCHESESLQPIGYCGVPAYVVCICVHGTTPNCKWEESNARHCP